MTSLAVDEVQMLGLGTQVQVTHWQGRPSWAAGVFRWGGLASVCGTGWPSGRSPPPPADFSPPQDSLGLLDNFTGDLESLTSLCIWKWGCWGQHQTSFGASVYILLGLY